MLVYLISTLIGGLIALAVFAVFFSKGQFDDMEDVKYQVFRSEENTDNENIEKG